MNKMKNFKRRFSLSVPRTETIEESLTEFTEQFNQLNNQRNEGKGLGKQPGKLLPHCLSCLPHGGVKSALKRDLYPQKERRRARCLNKGMTHLWSRWGV